MKIIGWKFTDSDSRHFLKKVRGYDITEASDVELRAVFQEYADRPDDEYFFAAVTEAIRRRLGIWQIFDSEFNQHSLSHYRDLADEINKTSLHRSEIKFYTDDQYLDSDRFLGVISDGVARYQLDELDTEIVKTLAWVLAKMEVSYHADIDLSSQFYKAIRERDCSGVLTFEPTDEQIWAGRLLMGCNVVEMDAGEGKTLAAAFAVAANGLSGETVHVATANDYLALRDAEMLAPLYEFLGLDVSTVLSYMSEDTRRTAYRKQVVYGTLREFGFDFLRDNLRHTPDSHVQGKRQVMIVDEADHTLIDEARTPLIIAGRPRVDGRSIHAPRRVIEEIIKRQERVTESLIKKTKLDTITSLAKIYVADPSNPVITERIASDKRLLTRIVGVVEDFHEDSDNSITHDLYYELDLRKGVVTLTERGQRFLEEQLGPLFDTVNLEGMLDGLAADECLSFDEIRLKSERIQRRISRCHNRINQVYQLLRAYLLLDRDQDYIIANDEIVLVDRFTGRRRVDTKYQHGLQAALQAKEGLSITPENELLAYLTVEGFARHYGRLSGMTGTALQAEAEFRRNYGVSIVRVPSSQASKRTDYEPLVCATRLQKLEKIVRETKAVNGMGRPVLVGTLTVEQSEEMSQALKAAGIEHQILNAVTNEDEAELIRRAGSYGVVTVATNMAGRGTDILLDDDLDERVLVTFLEQVRPQLFSGQSLVVECATPQVAAVLFEQIRELGDVAYKMPDDKTVMIANDRGLDSGLEPVRIQFGLGLHVIGTEVNDSYRVDLQLRGRAGRQGAYGSSKLIVSLEDQPVVYRGITGAYTSGDGSVRDSEAPRLIDRLQSAVEQDAECIRNVGRDYDRVIEQQTNTYYGLRRSVTKSNHCFDDCLDLVTQVTRQILGKHFQVRTDHTYDQSFNKMTEELMYDFGIDASNLWGLGSDNLEIGVSQLMAQGLNALGDSLGPHKFDQLSKNLFLMTGDDLWTGHLQELQGMMTSASLSNNSYSSGVAGFALEASREYRTFIARVHQKFLSTMLISNFAEPPIERLSDEMTEEIETILV